MHDKLQAENGSFLPSTQLQIKIVFWGSAYSGKTTTLRFLVSRLKQYTINKPLSVETTDRHTLYLDYVPLLVPLTKGSAQSNCLIHLVTTTGQKRFLCTRERAARGADTVVFVADSGGKRKADNIRSYDELTAFTGHGEIPIVIQANKQDLKGASNIDEIRMYLNLPADTQVVPTVATNGEGLGELFFAALNQALMGVSALERTD
jgi:signal recognition particle receptor subunit beta